MISQEQSNAIVLIRAIAMLSIVLCHVFQAYHSPLANLFNVGVPIFFGISGYLYGNKQIGDWKQWAFDRFTKVYVPYAVFLLLVVSLYAVFCPYNLTILGSVVQIFNLQGITHWNCKLI